ncbi:MAG: HK97 family phage prohead protease [Pseudomonadota bacterium]|nr:HK97 family phage prohead protease [Pseudomonadota bacterium]MDE3038574.1 HK97 family phage prohead protease [Pseudomonadota bacterium]
MDYEKKISAARRERKRLDCRLAIKSLDGQGRFAGYASVFDILDSQHDIILRRAFMRTLKGRSGKIKLLWQHRQDEPIGVFDRMFEDARGLYVEGRLLLSVARAQEAYSLLKAGAISGLSIGYSPVKFSTDAKTGVRKLADVDLWEISLVTFPANEAAGVTVVKQAEPQWRQAMQGGQVIKLAGALDRAIVALRV